MATGDRKRVAARDGETKARLTAPRRTGSKESGWRWPQWLSVAAIGGVVGLLANATGVVYAVFPGLKPDPAEKQIATAKIVVVEPYVPLGDYVQRIGRREVPKARIRAPSIESLFPDIEISPALRQRFIDCLPGVVYYVQQNLEGFKDRSTSIKAFTYDTKSGRLSNTYESVSGGTPFLLRHGRTTDQSIVPVWVQYPFQDGRFFVRVGIFHDHTMLSLDDSDPFRMTEAGYTNRVLSCVQPPKPPGA
jgi:hypothetical protein